MIIIANMKTGKKIVKLKPLIMETYTPNPLDPILQSYYEVYNVLEPDNELSIFECVRQGLRYCIANNVEPDQAILDLSDIEPFVNVQ